MFDFILTVARRRDVDIWKINKMWLHFTGWDHNGIKRAKCNVRQTSLQVWLINCRILFQFYVSFYSVNSGIVHGFFCVSNNFWYSWLNYGFETWKLLHYMVVEATIITNFKNLFKLLENTAVFLCNKLLISDIDLMWRVDHYIIWNVVMGHSTYIDL